MKIIPLINEIANSFNEIFTTNLNPLNLESKIRDVGDLFTLRLYESFLNYFDEQFKNKKQRKAEYNIKETRERTLITSLGVIKVNYTSYKHKKTKEYYVPLRDILHLKPYQRLTNEAEYQLVKYAMDENMSQSARHALRNTVVSRSTVSKKIKALDGSIKENIIRSTHQPDTLYIEMDEIHANLQKGGNKICPCAIVHEGYEEDFVKRKKLKNIHYFASSKLSYKELWEVIYDYVDKKYDLSYIFKDNILLKKYADDYLRNDNIQDFKILVKYQIEKYPEQAKQMRQHMHYIINNLEGIKNQKNTNYHCPCSMEGHVNHGFARYITSSPYGFSEQGLENKLKLLVYHANKHELTIEDYYNLKYGNNNYEEINIKVRKLCNIKYDQKLISNYSSEYKINTSLPILDTAEENNRLKELISIRQEFYII